MSESERFSQMIRTYRVTVDIELYAATCDIKSIRLVETKNIKNVMHDPSKETL